MFEKKIIDNLAYPKGIFGLVVGTMLKGNIREYLQALRHMDIVDGLTVLDIGCGPGYGINEILKMNSTVRADGMDISSLMVRKARRNTDPDRVSIIHGDFIMHDFGTMKYDRIVMLNLVYFVNDLKACIGKAAGILSGKGKIILGIAAPELLETLLGPYKGSFHLHEIQEAVDALKSWNLNIELHEDEHQKGSFYIVGSRQACR